jgi:hypothetical protein
MNRLHIQHWAALVPLILGVLVLFVTLTSINGACVAPATGELRSPSDTSANSAEMSGKSSHCLIYGKYCLGDTLRSR